MAGYAVELVNIRKSFGNFIALDDVSFAAEAGAVHALLGENGAGKSTLMNVLAGLYAPDSGSVRLQGEACRLDGPLDAVRRGVGMIHQHFKLVLKFTVLENVRLALAAQEGSRDARAVEGRIHRMAGLLGADIDTSRRAGSLSIAERQRVEIIKALVLGSRILVLDEPTAVLTEAEAQALYQVMRNLAADGVCIIIVTHKLADVRAVASAATIMRQGRVVARVDPARVDAAELTQLTVGTGVPVPRRSAILPGAPCLRVTGLSSAADTRVNLDGAGFELRAGEIYGMAGIGGNGQTELVDILAGVGRPKSGRVELCGRDGWQDITRAAPRALLAQGLVCIPADRHHAAMAGRLSVAENFAVAHLGRALGSPFWVDRAAMTRLAAAAVAEADVQGVRSLGQRIGLLSGGNAQKLVVARELSRRPRVIVAHSPCRGLDARAAAAVQARLIEARDAGIAVLLISEDLDEVLAISDRIGVMSAGRVVAEFDAPASRTALGAAMVDHA